MRKAQALALFIIAQAIVMVVGGFVTSSSVGTWYTTIQRPGFSPPNWVFSPVWIILYVLIALAGWFIWLQKSSSVRSWALGVWIVQSFVNVLWCFVFFGFHSILGGLINLIVLDVLVLFLLYLCVRCSWVAFWLLVPYCLWILFATALNIGFYVLN